MPTEEIVCSFMGHRVVPQEEAIARQVRDWIALLAKTERPLRFLNGGMGNFDRICADEVAKYRQDHPQFSIQQWLVLPFRNYKPSPNLFLKPYDKVILPASVESLQAHYAIQARNRWMMEQADYVLAYWVRNRGGAYQALRYALSNPKTVVVQIGGMEEEHLGRSENP